MERTKRIIFQYSFYFTKMLAPPIFSLEHKNLNFDFEDYIKNELGLDLNNQNKREGWFFFT